MHQTDIEETKALWNRLAEDWDLQVGDEGDSNRIQNSDPVLWDFAGDVSGLDVLDAGCGTGYLSRQLSVRGARVTGVDISEEMIAIAHTKAPTMDLRVDSCSDLKTVGSASVDMVIANYVLMDTPDLDATMMAFSRVLRPNGVAIVVFSHPCFPQGRTTVSADRRRVDYHWELPYFEHWKCTDPPWGHFTSDFIWFHRPLSDYWKAFRAVGFDVLELEEPRLTEDRYHLAADERDLNNSKSRPYSIAFKLRKAPS